RRARPAAARPRPPRPPRPVRPGPTPPTRHRPPPAPTIPALSSDRSRPFPRRGWFGSPRRLILAAPDGPLQRPPGAPALARLLLGIVRARPLAGALVEARPTAGRSGPTGRD